MGYRPFGDSKERETSWQLMPFVRLSREFDWLTKRLIRPGRQTEYAADCHCRESDLPEWDKIELIFCWIAEIIARLEPKKVHHDACRDQGNADRAEYPSNPRNGPLHWCLVLPKIFAGVPRR
jgi:hypothetical protein